MLIFFSQVSNDAVFGVEQSNCVGMGVPGVVLFGCMPDKKKETNEIVKISPTLRKPSVFQ